MGTAVRTPRSGATEAPKALKVLAGLGAVFLVLPTFALIVRTPWVELPTMLTSHEVGRALRLSLLTSLGATALSAILGLPLAWILARSQRRWVRLLRGLVMLPLVLPPVVGGIALLFAFGRHGIFGRWLNQWFGVTIPFTPWAVVFAGAFVAMPFLVITLEGAMRSVEWQIYEESAATLGASGWQRFRRVTLPLLRPALVAGSVLCWARALGEFGATITFAGSFPGTTQTMPISAYLALEIDPRAATGIAAILLLLSLSVLIALRGHWWTSPDT